MDQSRMTLREGFQLRGMEGFLRLRFSRSEQALLLALRKASGHKNCISSPSQDF